MCGIAAIFAYHQAAPEVDRAELQLIRDHMTSRGPDGAGMWFSGDGRIGMGHRRLAIIDLSEKAAQPMQTQDGSLVIAFNGEIYNYKEIRESLKRKGYIFESDSDTEVLLHLYQEKKEAMVHDLRGMFAFDLWDEKKKAILLARDPYGIKPLYYADDGGTLRVASQVKALLAGGKVSYHPEPAGLVGFFLTGSVPEPFTTYQEIRQVPSGNILWIDPSGPSEPKPYFSMAQIFSDANEEVKTLPLTLSQGRRKGEGVNDQYEVREALLDSVKHHMVSDVPVGVFLSSGIDSGAITGLAFDLGFKDLETVTVAFEEFFGQHDDEAPLAKEVARLYGTRHHERIFTQSEFKSHLDHFFDAMDQPTIDGLNAFLVSKAAQEIGLKVALSGTGGDELFGGYPSFHDLPRNVQIFSVPSRIPFLGDIFRYSYSASHAFFSSHPRNGGILKYGGDYAGAYFLQRGLFMPWELKSILDQELAHEGFRKLQFIEHIRAVLQPDPKTSFGRVSVLESSLYMRNQLLRDTDWSGMAHSLEIRTPFVDLPLLKTLAPITTLSNNSENGIGKKKLLTGSLRNSLPKKVLERTKTGFSVPIEKWMEQDANVHSWQKIPSLERKNCHWARRWAYVVMERQKDLKLV